MGQNGMKTSIVSELSAILNQAIEKSDLESEKIVNLSNKFTIEEPADISHGHLATNLALVGAKILKMSPDLVANKILNQLDLTNSSFERFEFARPGFINFFLKNDWFFNTLKTIIAKNKNFGKINLGEGRKVIVEFVSANPTGPMHVGNARGGVIGDCLAELFNWAGFDVCREFYLNDAGNQIEKFKRSLNIRYLQMFSENETLQMPEDSYHGEDIVNLAKEFYEIHGSSFVSVSENERQQALLDFALPKNVDSLKFDLNRYRIVYDKWFRESELYENNKVFEIVEKLKKAGVTYEKNGAVWFEFSKLGGSKDEVLIRENKIATYFAADIAYHYNKLVDRGFDLAINVWGADHHGHVARLKGALKALGINDDKLKVVLMQLVRLVRNGKTVKLSKRSGKAITLSSLLDEVCVDAARFFFNLREASSHFDFDLDLAVENSNNNPVYYVQYAYARICQILNKVSGLNDVLNFSSNLTYEFSELEKLIVNSVANFEKEIETAVLTLNPSLIAKFVVDLATKFHKFYSSVRVIGEQPEVFKSRLLICVALKIVFENAFSILKIEARTKL